MVSNSRIRVCHIADIHWAGGTRRHDEYRSVFETFFAEVKKIKPDVIYIGGDIFHTKTQNISPEVLECLNWWFTSMASIADVIVTLGNHDGNLMNLGRQDAITPIVNMLNNPKITLYKDSGVYKSSVPGVNWCVYSCFDEKNWDNVKPVPGEINIASFHGSVRGSLTDSDFALKSDVTADFFDGYDFVLLGDIHKMQFLEYRDCVDGHRKPWMGYCGSTIQQNYGEGLEHGFLYWDIRSRDDFDVEFISLPNHNKYITVDWANDITELISCVKDVGNGSRIRVKSSSTIPQADWRRIVHVLKNDIGAKEVISKIDTTNDLTSKNVVYEATNDLRDVKTLSRMIRDFYEDEKLDVWDHIDTLLEKYVKLTTESDSVIRNTRWSIDQLEFDNTFAYGANNLVDFSSLSGITGIFAGNATGKSSIIGTMMYALFNATDRGPMKNLHVINTRKDYCSARAVVTIDGKKYEIIRSSKRQIAGNGLTHAVTSLDFKQLETAELLNGEQRTVTEKYVRQHIGTADDFMLTSLAVQGGLKAFINEGAAQRKSILSKFLDLQLFEQIYDLAKKDSAVLRARVKDMPERDWAALKREIETKKGSLRNEITSCDSELTSLRNDLADKRIKIAGFGETTCVTQGDIDKKSEFITSLNEKRTQLLDQLNNVNVVLESLRHRLEIIERVKQKFPLSVSLEREKRYTELSEWISGLERQLKVDRHEIEQKQKSVLTLAEVPCGDQYPMCKYIRDSHDDKKELPRLQQLFDQLRNTLSDKKLAFATIMNDKSLDKLKRYRRIVAKEQGYRLELAEKNTNKIETEYDIDNNAKLLENERNELETMRQQLGTGDATLEYRRLRDDIADIENSISSIDSNRISIAQKIGRLDESLEHLNNEKIEYAKLASEWRAYEKLIQATSKGGIPSQILRHLTPAINNEIARILVDVVGFTIELELPEDSNEMNVYIDYGDNRRIIELGSGMEKMIASIAIRVALINVSSLPKTDMLIIDEGFSELDDDNIDACGQLLRQLTMWFKNIIIITHIDTLKDVVDNVIDITRPVGLDAKVYYA